MPPLVDTSPPRKRHDSRRSPPRVAKSYRRKTDPRRRSMATTPSSTRRVGFSTPAPAVDPPVADRVSTAAPSSRRPAIEVIELDVANDAPLPAPVLPKAKSPPPALIGPPVRSKRSSNLAADVEPVVDPSSDLRLHELPWEAVKRLGVKASGVLGPHDEYYRHNRLVGSKLSPASAKTYANALRELENNMLVKDLTFEVLDVMMARYAQALYDDAPRQDAVPTCTMRCALSSTTCLACQNTLRLLVVSSMAGPG